MGRILETFHFGQLVVVVVVVIVVVLLLLLLLLLQQLLVTVNGVCNHWRASGAN